jgi:flagellar hook-associated protein 1 FlgK
MYLSTFTTLQTALSGVEAAEQELDTTGENISNDDTPDYETQTVQLSPSTPLTVAGNGGHYQIGSGVNVTGVTNTSDPYLDAAWRAQNSSASAATTLQTYMEQIQAALGNTSEDDSGVEDALETYWSAWNDLADNPTSEPAKGAVVDDGENVASQLNSLSNELTGSDSSSVISEADAQYDDLLGGPTGSDASGGEVYQDASEITSLNKEIAAANGGDENVNTLIDQRNEYIDDLSALGNVSATANEDGSVTVYFGGVTGQALVSDPTSDTTGGGGNDFSSWSTAFTGELADASSASSAANTVGGTLGALLGLAGISGGTIATSANLTDTTTLQGSLGSVLESLNTMASDLASEVNGVLTSNGYTDADDFFVADDGTDTVTAANIGVSSTYTADADTLSAGVSGGGSSDSTVAIAEGENSGGSADSDFGSFVETVGNLAQSAEENESTQSALSTQITNQRDSAEGVDLDQEMSNLIQEQQAYEASAKVMNAFNTVMDSLMEVVS